MSNLALHGPTVRLLSALQTPGGRESLIAEMHEKYSDAYRRGNDLAASLGLGASMVSDIAHRHEDELLQGCLYSDTEDEALYHLLCILRREHLYTLLDAVWNTPKDQQLGRVLSQHFHTRIDQWSSIGMNSGKGELYAHFECWTPEGCFQPKETIVIARHCEGARPDAHGSRWVATQDAGAVLVRWGGKCPCLGCGDFVDGETGAKIIITG